MKFLISLILTLGTAQATPIIISYEGEREDAQIFFDILRKDYHVPSQLMDLIASNDCEGIKAKGKIDLCVKSNGDLHIVSVDRSFIEESLKVFRAP